MHAIGGILGCGTRSFVPVMIRRSRRVLEIAEKDGYWYQYGIISYGFGCGTVDFKVFVRVVSFLPWIKDTINRLS